MSPTGVSEPVLQHHFLPLNELEGTALEIIYRINPWLPYVRRIGFCNGEIVLEDGSLPDKTLGGEIFLAYAKNVDAPCLLFANNGRGGNDRNPELTQLAEIVRERLQIFTGEETLKHGLFGVIVANEPDGIDLSEGTIRLFVHSLADINGLNLDWNSLQESVEVLIASVMENFER